MTIYQACESVLFFINRDYKGSAIDVFEVLLSILKKEGMGTALAVLEYLKQEIGYTNKVARLVISHDFHHCEISVNLSIGCADDWAEFNKCIKL